MSPFRLQTVAAAARLLAVWAMKRSVVFALALTMPLAVAHSGELQYGPLPYPAVNSETWVLIEIWPTVGDITLSAYFLGSTNRRNENLCNAAKGSLDRDAAAEARDQKRESTSYRQCLTIKDAVEKGYIEPSISP